MFDFKNKKSRMYLISMLISLAILLIVFYATDGLLGDKEFSEYTYDDWTIAILPLSIIIVSGISTLVFALIILIPLIWKYPALIDYTTNKKFADIDLGTEFLAFDLNEFKRACCRTKSQNGLWISIKEYDLNSRKWTILEEGRYIENVNDVAFILQNDYKYDRVKFYRDPNYQQSPITLPLTNIQKVDEAGIFYLDNKGNLANIDYFNAYNGWCKSKRIQKSKPKYICDRTKSEGWKLVFHTNPQITFYSDSSEEELWIEILNKITLQGYPSFDMD